MYIIQYSRWNEQLPQTKNFHKLSSGEINSQNSSVIIKPLNVSLKTCGKELSKPNFIAYSTRYKRDKTKSILALEDEDTFPNSCYEMNITVIWKPGKYKKIIDQHLSQCRCIISSKY